jgi:hypothetical protein
MQLRQKGRVRENFGRKRQRRRFGALHANRLLPRRIVISLGCHDPVDVLFRDFPTICHRKQLYIGSTRLTSSLIVRARFRLGARSSGARFA